MRFNKSAKQSINSREDIKELSLKYLDKYQPSKKDLRFYLYRKVLDTDYLNKDKKSILQEIDMVISNLERRKDRYVEFLNRIPFDTDVCERFIAVDGKDLKHNYDENPKNEEQVN